MSDSQNNNIKLRPWKLNLEELVKFFDEIPKGSEKQATSMVSMFGEDLALALLRKYCEAKKYTFEVLGDVCTPGTKWGSRLDAWIRVDTDPIDKKGLVYYFQTEIKNWSAHALDGIDIPVRVRTTGRTNKKDEKETWDELRFSRFRREFRVYYKQKGSDAGETLIKNGKGNWKNNKGDWEKVLHIDGEIMKLRNELEFFYSPAKVMKVVKKMKLDKEPRLVEEDKERDCQIHPLLCYWFAPYPCPQAGDYKSEDKLFDTDEFFNLQLSEDSKRFCRKGKRGRQKVFDRLYVFSMSSFARNIMDRNDPCIPENTKATFETSPMICVKNSIIDVRMGLLGIRKDWIDRIFPPADEEVNPQGPPE